MPFNSYYNAKLLLTAEYLVLNGAQALAFPLRFGQHLQVEENGQNFISWQAIAHDASTWFSGKYELKDFTIIESNNQETAKHPQRLLIAARKLNPGFCKKSIGYNVISTLNYPLPWGIGSSSTLIAAIAGWAGIDPFKLHFKVSSGSGYDIACAISKGPVLYSLEGNKPNFENVKFSPSFTDRIFFVYQGNKQDSDEGIKKYRLKNPLPDKNTVEAASLLTRTMLHSSTLTEFEQVMSRHENLISSLTGVPVLRETTFNDLPGEAKSLGAWGGDFCMITWRDDLSLLPAYLLNKGLGIWFNFNDIVL